MTHGKWLLLALFSWLSSPVFAEPRKVEYGEARRGSAVPWPQAKIDALEKEADDLMKDLVARKISLEDAVKKFDKMDAFAQREMMWQAIETSLGHPNGADPKKAKPTPQQIAYGIAFSQEIFEAKAKAKALDLDYFADVLVDLANADPDSYPTAMTTLLVAGRSAKVWELYDDALENHPEIAAAKIVPWMEKRKAYEKISGPKDKPLLDLIALQERLVKKGAPSVPLNELLLRFKIPEATIAATKTLLARPPKEATKEQMAAFEKNRGTLTYDLKRRVNSGEFKNKTEYLPIVRELAGQSNPTEIREWAAYAWGSASPKEFIAHIEELATSGKDPAGLTIALNHVEDGFNGELSDALSPTVVVPLLAKKDLDPELKKAVMNKLHRSKYPFQGNEPFLPALLKEWMQSANEADVAYALRVLQQHPTLATKELLQLAFAWRVKRNGSGPMADGQALPGAIVANELRKLMEKSPPAAKDLIPELIAMAGNDDEEKEPNRLGAITALGTFGDERAADVLVKAISRPRPFAHPGYYEFEYIAAAKGLARLVKTNDKVNEPLAKKLSDFLAKSDLTNGPAQRILRRFLPSDLRAPADDEKARKMMAQRQVPTNACKVICNLFEKMPLWAHNGLFLKPDAYFRADKPLFTWELATKSLGALFMSKAAPYCSADKKVATKIADDWFKEPTPLQKTTADDGDAFFEKALQDAGVDTSGLDLFGKQAVALSSKERPTPNSIGMFGKGFYTSFLRTLPDAKAASIANNVSDSLLDDLIFHPGKETENGPEVDLEKERDLRAPKSGNSHTGSFHYSVALLNANPSPSDPRTKVAVGRLIDLRKKVIERHGNANLFPYGMRFAMEKDESPRDSAARSAVANVAIYLHDTRPEEKEKNAAFVDSGIENYVDHFYAIFSSIGDNHTHDMYDQGMAPYYGPGTIGFVTSALERRLKEEKDAGKKAKLLALRDKLRDRLMSLFDFSPNELIASQLPALAGTPLGIAAAASAPDRRGLFIQQGKDVYGSAAVYDNPLAGLALLSLMDPDKDKCPEGVAVASPGIIATKGRTEQAPMPRPSGSAAATHDAPSKEKK